MDENVQQYSMKFSSFEDKHTKVKNYQWIDVNKVDTKRADT
jgi:hypothetical protein